ncbi:MAG: DUF3572 domain-containing protein [Pseudomonadota bacterium]
MVKNSLPEPAQAETDALHALGWLAADPDLLSVFLGASGTDASDLRARAGDRDFLASLMDFILMDDAWVLACADANGWPPEHVARIRQRLPGGDLPNWT